MRSSLENIRTIEEYLLGQMEKRQAEEFENELKQNPELRTDLELQKQIIKASKRKAMRHQIEAVAATGYGGFAGNKYRNYLSLWGALTLVMVGLYFTVIQPNGPSLNNTETMAPLPVALDSTAADQNDPEKITDNFRDEFEDDSEILTVFEELEQELEKIDIITPIEEKLIPALEKLPALVHNSLESIPEKSLALVDEIAELAEEVAEPIRDERDNVIKRIATSIREQFASDYGNEPINIEYEKVKEMESDNDNSLSESSNNDVKKKSDNGPITSTFDIRDFTSVSVSIPAKIQIIQKNEFLVKLTVSEKLKKYLIVDKHGDELRIRFKKGRITTFKLGSKEMYGVVCLPVIKGIDASSASKVTFDKIDAKALSIDVSGASKVKGKTNSNSLKLSVSGASNSSLSGSAGATTIECSGASTIKFNHFNLDKKLSVDCSGMGEIRAGESCEVNVKKADFDVSGMSEIDFHKISAEDIDIELSGMSSFKSEVQCRNISADASGMSKVELSGSAKNVSIDKSGNSSSKLKNLNSDDIIIND